MTSSRWNRAARKSGGNRRAFIPTAPMTPEELQVLLQEQAIRKEFGEEGVRRFYEEMEKREKREKEGA
jgi:hypothetical protein